MKTLDRVRQWARGMVRDVVALWLAARDPRVPWGAKAVAACVAAYALSPIDLIPDFIPVIGYLDDLVLVPFGILLAVRLVPAALMAEFRAAAEGQGKPVSRAGAVIIVVIWVAGTAVAGWMVWRGCEDASASWPDFERSAPSTRRPRERGDP